MVAARLALNGSEVMPTLAGCRPVPLLAPASSWGRGTRRRRWWRRSSPRPSSPVRAACWTRRAATGASSWRPAFPSRPAWTSIRPPRTSTTTRCGGIGASSASTSWSATRRSSARWPAPPHAVGGRGSVAGRTPTPLRSSSRSPCASPAPAAGSAWSSPSRCWRRGMPRPSGRPSTMLRRCGGCGGRTPCCSTPACGCGPGSGRSAAAPARCGGRRATTSARCRPCRCPDTGPGCSPVRRRWRTRTRPGPASATSPCSRPTSATSTTGWSVPWPTTPTARR